MKNDELIDKFVLDELTEEEKIQLDELYVVDSSLKEDLEFRLELVKAVRANEEERIRERLVKTERQIVKSRTLKRIVLSSSAAAVLFVVVFTYFKIVDTDGSQDISQVESTYIEKYYKTPPFILAPVLKGEAEAKQEEPAYTHFKNKDYEKACPLFEELLTHQPSNDWIKFYTGVTYMETGHYEKAHEIFKALSYEGSIAEITSTWYIALIYLDQDRLEEARPLLEKIVVGVNEFKEEAKEILTKL